MKYLLILILLTSCVTHRDFYSSSIVVAGETRMTYRETFLYLREINTESKFDSVMRDYDRIVVDDSGVIKKYSVAEFKKLIFPVTHRPRYNHWAKPYKMYEPVKQHKPNLK